MGKYALGIDFGTLSARAVLLDVDSGTELAEAVSEYADGVIERNLPNSNIKLENKWALQNPNDYITSFVSVCREISATGYNLKNLIGIGIDFTSCTVLPVNSSGTPFCNIEKWKDNPHSWVKLWKHHAAQPQADKINEVAHSTNNEWIHYYGGKISSEWLFPKLLQILEEDQELYEEMDSFIEAGDWLVWQLTGNEKRSLAMAGYKAMYDPEKGFPGKDYFKAINPLFENVVAEKLNDKYFPVTAVAGGLKEEFSRLTGLPVNTPVSVANIDAHVAVSSTGITQKGQFLSVIGTSSCDIVLSDKKTDVKGISGVVLGGGGNELYAYESGQNAVGDIFGWFIEELVPEKKYIKAKENNISIFELLENEAEKMKPGSNGLLALDWHNGSRSVLMDTDLTGTILGLTLNTKSEEIFRALIEATAYGKRQIIETYEAAGIKINEIKFTGGISYKNKLLNQIYADVLGRQIIVSPYLQTPAIGAAIFAAVAADKDLTIEEIQSKLDKNPAIYYPNEENAKTYNELYKEYISIHDYFGKNSNTMKKLLKISRENGDVDYGKN